MIFTRRTLRSSRSFQGSGLHTGVPVKMTVHPGDDGIAFRIGGERVIARPANVTDTTRSTKLGSIGTVEHLMSAFCGLEISDAEVELDAPEVPALDGSSLPYVEGFLAAGFDELGEIECRDMFKRVFYQEPGLSISIGKGSGTWRYVYLTGKRWPFQQNIEIADVVADYETQIAPSRTFALVEEIPKIIQAGLGKGLDDTSVLVLGVEGYKNDARFTDEPARHKLLDILGDLYLSGVPARALSVVAERSGHRANVKAAALLLQAVNGEVKG